MIDNLVVNPAGTHGRRFLLTTLALEVSSTGAVEALIERDAEVRDALSGVLGAKTVTELSDTAARAALKEALKQVVEDSVGVRVFELYVPQFVIQ
jgi:flagellar basal body-associated protein FliL